MITPRIIAIDGEIDPTNLWLPVILMTDPTIRSFLPPSKCHQSPSFGGATLVERVNRDPLRSSQNCWKTASLLWNLLDPARDILNHLAETLFKTSTPGSHLTHLTCSEFDERDNSQDTPHGGKPIVMGVSQNGWFISMGKTHQNNGWFRGTTFPGNLHLLVVESNRNT